MKRNTSKQKQKENKKFPYKKNRKFTSKKNFKTKFHEEEIENSS